MLTEKDVARLLDIANAGINHGEIAEARVICEGILAARPQHIPTRITLAVSHAAVGEFEKAEELLLAVLAEHPDDADALAYLGLSYHLAG